jgi:ABC-2 type transport system permease protein
MLFIIPLLTMRLFAEEKKSGTIELLSTYPLRDIDILLGKFGACLVVFVLMLGLSLLYPIILNIIYPDQVNIGPLLAIYLGTFLLGCAFISCGILISSLTENQITAAMVTLGILVLFWYIAWNEGAGSESVVNILLHLSLFDHYSSFTLGVVETKNIVFLLSFIVFSLFLTLRSLGSRRWRGLR